MKRVTISGMLTTALVLFAMFLNGCLITEVKQPKTVAPGGEFQTTITVSDMTADGTPHEGVLLILTPSDWTFTSGTYTSPKGSGSFKVDASNPAVYGNIDTTIIPPAGMKWIKLVTDQALANDANAIHEAVVKLKAGTKTGDFKIGYVVTKNTADMLKAMNLKDTDNDAAWSDSSMNHMVTVKPTSDVEGKVLGQPTVFALGQNYPNPFNPSTMITFNVPQASHAKLSVFNSLGQEIAVLFEGFVPAGEKTVKFDAKNLNSGIYLYKLEAGSFSDVKKMLLVK